MKKGKVRIEPVTESTKSYVQIGGKYYEVHINVYRMIQLLLKKDKRKRRKNNERFEA